MKQWSLFEETIHISLLFGLVSVFQVHYFIKSWIKKIKNMI